MESANLIAKRPESRNGQRIQMSKLSIPIYKQPIFLYSFIITITTCLTRCTRRCESYKNYGARWLKLYKKNIFFLKKSSWSEVRTRDDIGEYNNAWACIH